MASSESDKSTESSPSYHPMILRSACRLCCSAETHLAVGGGSSRRTVRKSHLNGELSHFNHHHHIRNPSVTKKHIVKDERLGDVYVSKTVANHSSSTSQKETTSSENTAFEFSSSLDDSSLFEKLTSSLAVAAVAKKLASSASINRSSKSVFKEIYGGYSSGNESSDFHSGGEINSFCFKEEMSRTRSHTRTPLSSARFSASISDSDEDQSIDADAILLGRRNGNFTMKTAHLAEDHTDRVSLRKSQHYNNRETQMHGSAASRSNHLYAVEGSFNDQLHSSETLVEETYLSSASSHLPFPSSGSICTMLRWLFWRCIYLNICKVLLLDTWILSRCNTFGKKKILLILLLLLIPLWFLGAFFTKNYTSDITTHLPVLKSSDTMSHLFSYVFSSSWFKNKHQECDSSAICTNNPETSESIQNKLLNMWNFFLVKEGHSVESELSTSDQAVSKISVSSPGISDEKIKLLALEVFKKESSELMAQLEKRDKQYQDHVEQGSVESVRNEISLLTSQYQFLSDSLQVLKNEIRTQLKSDTVESSHNHSETMLLSSKVQDMEEKLLFFETMLASAKNCCTNQSDYFLTEAHVTSLMMKMMEGHEDENHPILTSFQNWLRSSFISQKNLSNEISSVIEHMYGSSLKLSQEHYVEIAKKVAEAVISESMKSFKHDIINICKATSSAISTDQYAQGELRMDVIQKIVKEAILLYDADKTGLVDYALESGGGSIVSTRCSETYNAGTARLSIFGLPLWYTSKSPRTAIQPEVQPGECWAFHGSQGFLVIQLSATILPTGFSMEHIPKSLSPTGTIDSAPKEFSVWGLTAEKNDEGKLLGEFMYDSDGDPLQYFSVEEGTVEDYYSVVELKIHSNWGNQKYTCLYRFRVHGKPL